MRTFLISLLLSQCAWMGIHDDQAQPASGLLQASDSEKAAALQRVESRLAGADAALNQLDSLSFLVEFEWSNDGQLAPASQDGFRQVIVTMCKDGRFRAERRESTRRPKAFDQHFPNTDDGKGAALVVCDGEHVIEWSASENAWTRYPVEEPMAKTRSRGLLVGDMAFVRHSESWLDGAGSLNDPIRDGLADAANASVSIDEAIVDKQRCDRIIIRDSRRDLPMIMNFSYEVCFDAKSHLPVRQVLTVLPKIVMFPIGKQIQKSRYLDVRTNVPAPDELFAFDPPEGSVFIPPDDERFRRSVQIGEPAPALSLPSVGGETVEIADYKGEKAVLLSFWSTSCAPCLREMPMLIQLHEEFGDKGLAIVGVSVGDKISMLKSFLKKRPLPYTVVHDAERVSKKLYYLSGIPHTVLIDREGIVVRVWQGWDGEQEEKEVRQALARLGIAQSLQR